jgi:hypothetical protein
MSTTFTTPLMNLVLPVSGPGGEPGPTWADDLNDAFEAVDSHDHTSGKGSQVPTAGINVNADFSLVNFNLTSARSLRLTSQASSLSTASDKNCVSVVSGDLYYNNGSGTAIQLTSGSGLNAASIGGIGGDYATSSASVTYNNTTKTFSFTQSSGVTAKMSFGDLAIFENVSSAQGITIKSPTSLGSAYTLTLPTGLPASTKLLTVSSAGAIGATYDVDNSSLQVSGSSLGIKSQGVTQAMLAARTTGTTVGAGGVAISLGIGGFITRSSSFVDIDNLTLTITTTGRPVLLALVSIGGVQGYLSVQAISSAPFGIGAQLQLVRDVTEVAGQFYGASLTTVSDALNIPSTIILHLDPVPAGTYTYKLQALAEGDSEFSINESCMVAFEI